ncbi:MAG: TlpA family protein disulfide reductase [Bacteroidia bacterium]|nr:TlpA family protein disulfide reductase [Bacteroidia bacterium]
MAKSSLLYIAISCVALGIFAMAKLDKKQDKKPVISAPEISLKSPQGITHNLSALKGNFVMVEFWASWCLPCRRMNQKLVPAYRKLAENLYEKNAKFFIYSVSIDKDSVAWRKAITNDKLFWPHQVIDINGWDSKVTKDWEVSSIPTNFLINPKGDIIGKNVDILDVDSIIKNQKP